MGEALVEERVGGRDLAISQEGFVVMLRKGWEGGG